MRIPVIVTVVAMLVTAAGAAAEQTSTFGGLRVPQRDTAARRNPYGQLFGAPITATPPVAPSAVHTKAPATPTTKCGMTLIPGDAQADPRIAAPKPPDSQRFHSRIVEPTICR